MKTALLLSGGMDSTALAVLAQPEVAYTVDYGQLSARGEVRAAAAVCAALGLNHEVICIDCRTIGSGDLAGTPAIELAPVPEWWPFRNQLLITVAAARAVARGVDRILIGTVASDASHLDGTPQFIEAMRAVLRVQEGAIVLEAPAVSLTSAELIRRSGASRALLAWAHSCHRGEYACGVCRGCRKHFEVSREVWGDGY